MTHNVNLRNIEWTKKLMSFLFENKKVHNFNELNYYMEACMGLKYVAIECSTKFEKNRQLTHFSTINAS